MQDWDTRINSLKSDIQAAREKYVIPFMKVQPKPPNSHKEVSQSSTVILKETKLNLLLNLQLKNYMRTKTQHLP